MKIDLNVLKQLAPKYGVAPIEYIKGVKEAMAAGANQKAEAQHEPILTGYDYAWSDEDSAYHNGDQTIYAFPNKVFLWTWRGMGRVLQGTSRFQKWVAGNEEFPDGKANKFMEIYPQMTGQVVPSPKPKKTPNPPQTAKDRLAPTGEPEVASTPLSGPVPDRSEVAPPSGEADALIAKLWKDAGIDPKTKFFKRNPIRLTTDQQLDIIDQAKQMEPADKAKIIQFFKDHVRTDDGPASYKESVVTKSQLSELVRHIVRGVVNEMMQEEKIQDPTKEEMLGYLQRQNEEPVQETTGEKGWRVTAVGYPGMGRDSAPRYAVAQDYTTNYLTKNGNWGRPAEAATFGSYEEAQQFAAAKLGGGEVSEETGTAAVSPVATPFAFKKKNLAEMNTTDSGTTGYNVPGAFARKGGSVKGVAGSAALGYELTPIGKKEMNRTADKLLEGKKAKDGPICKFCKHPLHYAGQIECTKCGKVQK